MKTLVTGLLLLGSVSAFAASDCSFKISQTHKINDCMSALGRNCYTINSSVVDEVAQALKAKGYTSEVTDSTAAAGLEIDLATASRFIPGPPYKGEGYISISFVDNNSNDRVTVQKTTGEMRRKKMFKKLNDLVDRFPEVVASSVRSCP